VNEKGAASHDAPHRRETIQLPSMWGEFLSEGQFNLSLLRAQTRDRNRSAAVSVTRDPQGSRRSNATSVTSDISDATELLEKDTETPTLNFFLSIEMFNIFGI